MIGEVLMFVMSILLKAIAHRFKGLRLKPSTNLSKKRIDFTAVVHSLVHWRGFRKSETNQVMLVPPAHSAGQPTEDQVVRRKWLAPGP